MCRIEKITYGQAKRQKNHDQRKYQLGHTNPDPDPEQQNQFLEIKPLLLAKQEIDKKYEEKTGQKLSWQKNTKHFVRGIIAFSPIHDQEWHKYSTKKDWEPTLKEALKNLQTTFEKELNSEICEIAVHWDEKTPHIHFMAKNQNQETGRTLTKNLNKIFLSGLQDKIAENTGFVRGEKGSKTPHFNLRQMHEKEIQNYKKRLRAIKKEILKMQEMSDDLKRNIRKEINKYTRAINEALMQDNQEKARNIAEEAVEDIKQTIKNYDISL